MDVGAIYNEYRCDFSRNGFVGSPSEEIRKMYNICNDVTWRCVELMKPGIKISDLAKKADKTIFICTHLLDAAEELCDLIGIIDKGVLKVEGSPKEIIDSVNAKDLEDAYLKIMGATRIEDLLAWREEIPNNNEKDIKKKKKKENRKK